MQFNLSRWQAFPNMPEQRYEAARQTIGTLLATTSPHIEVPEWQRSYTWDTPQVEAFWRDLTEFGGQYHDDNIIGEEYFLGSIVLVVGGATNLLLDGQQRLATATVLLSALRDERRKHKADAATRLQNKYISDFDDATQQTTYVLTLNNYDRDFFRGEVQDEPTNPPLRPKPGLKSHGLIRKARLFFEKAVQDKSSELGGGEAAFNWNLRVSRVLCDHMSLVAVTSSDEDNAASVFETLNDRGIGLSTPDLLRNLLLRRAANEDARQRIVNAWQTILGTDDEASVEEYIRHFWVSKRGDVKARKLYREIKNKIIEEGIDSLELSNELANTAPVYLDIARAREDDQDLQAYLAGMRALGAKALYPAMLSGYAAIGEDGDKTKLRELAHALISLFVRYNVIGGRETTVMETTVYKVAAQLRDDKKFDEAVAGLAAIAPDAKDFVERFTRASISRIATSRYLLREIEIAKRRTQEMDVSGTARVHVEHIYPQTPQEGQKWPNHAAVINRLGNHTLLGKRLNTAIKNADFATKKREAYEHSDILMTQELCAYDDWTTETIAQRQEELSTWIMRIWGLPGEEVGKETQEGGAAAEEESLPAMEDPDQLPEVPLG